MHNPMLSQALQMLNLAQKERILSETLQVVRRARLLSSLLIMDDPTAVHHKELQRILGFDPSVFRVKLGGPKNTDQLVRTWRIAGFHVNNQIDQANFPLESHTPEIVQMEIVDPGKFCWRNEGLQFIGAAGLEPPTIEHSLRFVEQCAKKITSHKHYIVFHHEPWLGHNDFRRRVMILCLIPGKRYLGLTSSAVRFGENCLLIGVRPRSR